MALSALSLCAVSQLLQSSMYNMVNACWECRLPPAVRCLQLQISNVPLKMCAGIYDKLKICCWALCLVSVEGFHFSLFCLRYLFLGRRVSWNPTSRHTIFSSLKWIFLQHSDTRNETTGKDLTHIGSSVIRLSYSLLVTDKLTTQCKEITIF